VRIELRVAPRRAGWKTTNVRIGETAFALRQFVFP
jgi:hypothetical protein